MTLMLLLASIIGGLLLGPLVHEACHYVVWWVAGRRPVFMARAWCVRPTSGPAGVLVGDRAAAAAPYALGLLLVTVASRSGVVWIGAMGMTMLIPSHNDLKTIAGHGEWRGLETPVNVE